MKNLLFLILIASLSPVSVFAMNQSEPVISCQSGSVTGHYVNIFEKLNKHFAVMGVYWPHGSHALNAYVVAETLPNVPGASLKFVSPAEDFQLSICTTCTPVKGRSPAKLDARVHSLVFDDFKMLCSFN